ncbi:hypothetical protein B0H66DRAFT_180196 [Apodospora peruviana]|uniref:Uncharacterized protein n=1 Tax=Apodospora peruviana TaxID=516989 RepID=A0AAE0IB57_9PEZI|nr:hypothetical protein B0H66DRAFT_180196 [Apodospora peruviana]
MGLWTGSGAILTGTCSTAAWTLFDLSTAYLWAPVIGCVEDKIDCCPAAITSATPAPAPVPTPNAVPRCPIDYVSVGSTGCCPFGMKTTQSPGLKAACASQLTSTSFAAPEVTNTGLPAAKPISTATDVVYALQYWIATLESQPTTDGGLSTGAKAGIGVGSGLGALVLLAALVFLFQRRRRRRRIQTTTPVTQPRPDYLPPDTGPAEMLVDESKQRHELHDTQRYELSNTPHRAMAVPAQQQQESCDGSGIPNHANGAQQYNIGQLQPVGQWQYPGHMISDQVPFQSAPVQQYPQCYQQQQQPLAYATQQPYHDHQG